MKTVLIKNCFCVMTIVAMLPSPAALANYNAAMAAFGKKNYVAAAGAFFQAYAYPKDRAERAKAEWGLAESLRALDLLYSSSKYYSIIVRRGPKASNPFFKQALEQLGVINSTLSLGQSHIIQLFKADVDPAYVPGAARGFYFYYRGVEAYSKNRFEPAASNFKRVPTSSPYFLGAQFHLGVIANLSGSHARAITYFERVLNGVGNVVATAEMRDMAVMNIARIHYETRNYRQSIEYYAQIPRDSDNWLDAIWESSWAFFLMQKHNNTLGNLHTIHSPFFINRFYPESYILKSITFLRLCLTNKTKDSLREFRDRYKPVFTDMRSLLEKYRSNSADFFRIIYNYRTGTLNDYESAWSILDKLSRTDNYKEAGDTIRFSDKEISRLGSYSKSWKASGLENELQRFLSSKKKAAQADAGRRLYRKAATFYTYLKELSDQTGLIQAEMLETDLNTLRKKINIGTAQKKVNFIGGLQELNVGQDLEYWPFEGEYWEDELGGYVYNLKSKCDEPAGDDEGNK